MPPKKTSTTAAVPAKKAAAVPVPTPVSESDSEDDNNNTMGDSDSSSDDSDSSSDDDDDADADNQVVQLPPPSKQTTPIPTSTTPHTPSAAPLRTLKRTEVWLDIQVPPFDLGRVVIELYPDCPLAHENFRSLCTGEVTDPVTKEKMSYAGTLIDQINDDYIVLGEICDDADDRDGIEVIEDDFDADNDDSDDETVDGVKSVVKAQKTKKAIQKAAITSKDQKINIVHDTKKAAVSIYGGFFPDEPAGLQRQHIKAGTVSMFAEKTNRNGSKFLITLKPHMSWLDGQYTVVGQVTSGLRACHSLLSYQNTGETAVVSNCGRMKKNSQGVDKQNDFLLQAVELTTGKKQDKNEEKPQYDEDKAPVLCEKCHTPAKYRSRQLGKGCKYVCRSPQCGHGFFVKDTKYTDDIVEKAAELKKKAKQDTHTATILMQNHKYRQELHQKEKDARLAKKAAKEAETKVSKKGGKGKKDVVAPVVVAPVVSKPSKPQEHANIIYASPQLALTAQTALEGVVAHKREKAKAQVQGRKDHEKFVRERKTERGEYDEEGNDLNPRQPKRKHHQIDSYESSADKPEDKAATAASKKEEVVDAWFGGKGKKQKGNDGAVVVVAAASEQLVRTKSEKNQNKEMRKVYNDHRNPEHKTMHKELTSMSKDDRRQFKRTIGIQPGPSKTSQSNLNKRNADPNIVPKRSTFKSVQRQSHETKNDGDKKKKKNKTRWRERDPSALPAGYVVREERNKK